MSDPMLKALQSQAGLSLIKSRSFYGLKPSLDANGKIDRQAARRVAEEFEAMFLSSMVSWMFKGVKTDGPFQGGFAEKVWREHLFVEYGRRAARGGKIGIADRIYRDILMQAGEEPENQAVSRPVVQSSMNPQASIQRPRPGQTQLREAITAYTAAPSSFSKP